ncbi:MAG: SagB/ThcOx family dehydrogenase [Proteobacteria bacterium]|nr:SagB/ThcOx family dehydrogenase [Pseudomonadota bacterium]MBU4297028.1 SagB/ThcOx family dehydrogenase [Pseudomonadota bacterium]MCG2749909.1 SagB/ThcOx family dehydrogenase [Desulfobulbaceae bacterium]
MPDLQKTLGYRYLHDTKFTRKNIREKERPVIVPAPAFKDYPGAEKIDLPKNPQKPAADLWQLLQQRRSLRNFSGSPMSLDDLTLLLWACQGITAQAGAYLLRTAPSAGALYPIETYVAADRIEGLAPGLFHFNVGTFQLERLTDKPAGALVAQAALDQSFIGRAAAVFIWSAVLRRNMAKYGQRGLRYICMDVGHICQNLQLAAEALGRQSCPVAAIYDDELGDLLGLDKVEESAIYLAPVG